MPFSTVPSGSSPSIDWHQPVQVESPLPDLIASDLDDATFRLLAEHLPTLCWIANGDGHIVWYNRLWHEYCGTTPEEMEGWGWTKVHDPELLPLVIDRWTQSIKTGEPFEMTCALKGADGLFRPFLTRIQPVKDVTGRVGRWCGVNTEITEQVAAQQALKNAGERIQMAHDAGAIAGTWVWNIQADKVHGDALFARTFGLDEAECAAGLPLEAAVSAIHPIDRPQVEAAINRALETGGTYRARYRVTDANGTQRWIQANGKVDLGADGVPLRFPGVLIDVTDLVEAQAARDKTTAILETFIDAVPGVVYAKGLDGRMMLANRGTLNLVGKPLEEVIDKTDIEFLACPEQAKIIMDNDQRIMSRGVGEELEETVTAADGSVLTYLSRKEPLFDQNGEIIGLVGTSIDISDLKAAQAQLSAMNAQLTDRIKKAVTEHEAMMARVHEMQKLETLGQLTGGVAHDFNNLLSPVVGALDIVGRRHADDERTQKVVLVAQQAAESARTMVQRLLAFARRQHLEARVTSTHAVLSSMQDMLARLLGPRIELELDCPELPPVVVDPNQLELAVLNLAVNARDAMPDGGRLSITTYLCKLEGRDEEHVCIRVKDNGFGMDPETLKRAVEPFYTTKPAGRGTGLGLSSVHGLASQSGGAFELDSKLGAGTIVSLFLPVSEEAATELPQVEAARPPRGQGAILLVDDEELVRSSTAEMLMDAGYEVLSVGSSHKALRLVEEGATVDALVTDYAMPGLTGLELAQKVQLLRPNLPVLLITGYANVNVETGSKLTRLSKPFRENTLLKVLSELMESCDVRHEV